MASIIAEGIIYVGAVVDYTDSTSRGVSSVVTDNASAMKKVWTLLEKNYPTLVTLPCLAHTWHLVIKDILHFDPFTSAVANCLKVNKYFLIHHHPNVVL